MKSREIPEGQSVVNSNRIQCVKKKCKQQPRVFVSFNIHDRDTRHSEWGSLLSNNSTQRSFLPRQPCNSAQKIVVKNDTKSRCSVMRPAHITVTSETQLFTQLVYKQTRESWYGSKNEVKWKYLGISKIIMLHNSVSDFFGHCPCLESSPADGGWRVIPDWFTAASEICDSHRLTDWYAIQNIFVFTEYFGEMWRILYLISDSDEVHGVKKTINW